MSCFLVHTVVGLHGRWFCENHFDLVVFIHAIFFIAVAACLIQQAVHIPQSLFWFLLRQACHHNIDVDILSLFHNVFFKLIKSFFILLNKNILNAAVAKEHYVWNGWKMYWTVDLGYNGHAWPIFGLTKTEFDREKRGSKHSALQHLGKDISLSKEKKGQIKITQFVLSYPTWIRTKTIRIRIWRTTVILSGIENANVRCNYKFIKGRSYLVDDQSS